MLPLRFVLGPRMKGKVKCIGVILEESKVENWKGMIETK
jgi:hypothetical protein